MKYLSLFSGIGGFELGIQYAYESNNEHAHVGEKSEPEERAQGRKRTVSKPGPLLHVGDGTAPLCVGFSEIDPYAIKIYQSHFPNHKNYGDITKINEKTLPDFDVLVGGFPCQAFSIAGQRRGFEDTRGTLFFEIARILRHKKPRLFFLENVKGLLSHDNGSTFKTIVLTLNDLGYDLQWQVLNSKNHGVPQNRERVFIIGHLRGTPRPKVFPFGESNEQTYNELKTKIVGNTNNAGHGERSAVYDTSGIMGALTATDYKMPKQIHQLNKPTHSNDRVYGEDGISPALNTMQGGNRQPKVAVPAQWRRTEKGKQFRRESQKQGKDLTPFNDGYRELVPKDSDTIGTITSGAIAKDSLLFQQKRIRRLTPTECERLQGFPDGWTEGVSDTQRYKCLGNAVTVNVIRDIFIHMR